jgi:hypothetical protein
MLRLFRNRQGWPFILLTVVPVLFSCRTVSYLGMSDKPAVGHEEFVTLLPSAVNETSGLAQKDDRFWTFNDSGGKPELYSFQSSDPCSTFRIMAVSGIENTDWEAIASDNLSFYIADAGNNYGERDTLELYRIEPDTSSGKGHVSGIIKFSYPEKSPAFHGCRKNPFDSEALAVVDDSLWVFTKNWQDETSCIYIFPKPGHYSFEKENAGETEYFKKKPAWCLDPGMLVTGADYDAGKRKLWLIGYHHFKPVIVVYDLTGGGQPQPLLRIKMGNRTGLQTESILCAGDGYVYFTWEKSKRRQGMARIRDPFP